MQTAAQSALPQSPFELDDTEAYRAWRDRKLADRRAPEPIEVDRLDALSPQEHRQILSTVQRRNFALFKTSLAPATIEDGLRSLGKQLGLLDLDQNLCAEDSGLTEITVKPTTTEHTYIPYTSRPLGWHTDGYYNSSRQQVRAWLLFCVQPAAEGGANALMDHEIAYIRLRDQNPRWIRALMAADAFTIPGNVEHGEQIRPDHTGPVFSVDASGCLHMRYSARQRNIVWKADDETREAAAFLLDLLKRGDDHIFPVRLQAGEGVISNNILHRRDGFRDRDDTSRKRLLYRARYYQRLPAPREG
jgi:hypothetical protein